MKILKNILVITFCVIGCGLVANAFNHIELTPLLAAGSIAASYGMQQTGVAFGSLCGRVAAGVTLDCDNPIISGVDADLILFNRNEVDLATVTYNTLNKLIIEAMAMQATKPAFKFEGKNLSVVPKQSLVKKDFSSNIEHLIDFYVFTSTPDVKKNLESMKDGNLGGIVLNKFTGATGNAAYEVYGWDCGLEMFILERNLGDDVTGSAYKIQLKSNPKALEPHLPRNIFITSLAASKAVVDALLV
ncbi:MAG TPA: hypothetical protein VJY62_02430 [Bacteroidia bacterium]|nr:hypothetical protein [Bacteroidia bacterium]